MGSTYILGPNGELYHSGIKGMKWGIRRYQNKDGSLTPEGKKHYAKKEAALKEREKSIKNREAIKARKAKMAAKKAELDDRERALKDPKTKKLSKKEAAKPKSIKDMTDDELRERANRMELEKKFYEAQNNLAKVTPQKPKALEKIADKYLDDVVKSVVIEPAKKYVNSIIDKKLGTGEKDTLAKLERMWKEADYKKKIAEAERDTKKAKNPEKEKPNWDDKLKEQTYIQNRKKSDIAQQEYEAWLEEERKKRREQGED